MTTDTFTRTYRIPVDNLPRVREVIARINKRANKLGMQPLTLQIGEAKLGMATRVALSDGRTQADKTETQIAPVTIGGQQPVLAGYAFVAKLDFSAGPSPLVLGTDEIPAEYRTCSPDCDHCKKARERHTTFVLREIESGRHLQVGRSCLTDFFNGDDPFALTAWLQALYEIHDDLSDYEEYYGGDATANRVPVEQVLEAACAEVRVSGYLSKEKADAMLLLSTADAVREHFLPRRGRSTVAQVQPADREKAQRVRAWLASPEVDAERNQSTYMHNIATLGSAETVAMRFVGMLSSAVAAFDHHELRRLTAEDTRESQYIGEPDGKIERAVTILGRSLIPGDRYGDKMLYRLRDDDGNVMVWFCTGADIGVPGERLHITGTVKEHREYKGVRQTTLLRVTAAENKLYEAIEEGRAASAIAKLAAQPIEIDRLHHVHRLTPLMAAARVGRTAVVQTLLDSGADPNRTDGQGFTPAHYAAGLGYTNTVVALEDAGADLAAVARDGSTPLSLLEADQTALLDDVRRFRTPEVDTDERIWQRDAEYPVKGLMAKQEALDWFVEECERHAAEGQGDLRAQLAHQPYNFDVVIDMASGKPALLNGRRTVAYALSEGRKTVTALVGLKCPEAVVDATRTPSQELGGVTISDQ
ncbi:ankyrin repeat domain-containing protein [Cupriavidus sp. TMH.W2]|uniref:ankyrin repeat domain-containing protein n=1 Tax=Cupriavidus sp. TMH.W2 TaxID=3434465 RepID=UPI003D77E04E